MRSSGAIAVLGLLLVLAPATPAIAQSSSAPLSEEDPVFVAQRSDDHAVAVVRLPVGAVHPDHQTELTTYIGSAELGGEGDDTYELHLRIEPKHTGSGSMSLSETLWTVDAFLQRDPDSSLPALPERANDTVRETLDEVTRSVDEIEGRVGSLETLLEEVEDSPASGSETVNTTLDIARERMEIGSGLVEQLNETVRWLGNTTNQTQQNLIDQRIVSGEILLRLLHALISDTARLLEDGPEEITAPGPDTGEQTAALVDVARETAGSVNETWHQYVGWALTWESWGHGFAQNETDEGMARLAGWAGYGDDQLETTRDMLADLVGEPPAPLQENDNDENESDENDSGEGGLPITVPTVPTEHTTYRTVRENFTELSRPLPSATRNYSRDQVNRTADTIEDLEQALRFLAEDWLEFAGVDDEPGTGTTEDVQRLVDAARSDLERARDTLPLDDGGGNEPEDDDGSQDMTLRAAVHDAWASLNASQAKIDQARSQAHNTTLGAGGGPETLVERADAILSRPTQVRVWIPTGVPSDGETDLPDDLDEVPELPGPDDAPTVPDDEDDLADVDHEGPGDDPEGTLENETSTVDNETGDLDNDTADTPPGPPIPSSPTSDPLDSDDGDGGDNDTANESTGDSTDDGTDSSGTQDQQSSGDGTDDTSDDGSQTGSESQDGQDQTGGSGGSDGGASDQQGDGSGSTSDGQANQQAASAPKVTVDPGEVSTEMGRQRILEVEMRNPADEERTYHVTVGKDAPVALDSPGEGERTLAPGQTGLVRVRVSPTEPGQGTLTVRVSGPEQETTQQIPVEVGQAPEGANQLDVSVDPLNMRLATTETGRMEVTLENVGDALRTVEVTPWSRGPLEVSVPAGPSIEVPAGETATVPIDLEPQAKGLAEVPVKITSDQGDELRPVALLSLVGPGEVAEGQSTDQAAGAQPAAEEGNLLPFPGVLVSLAALGAAVAARRRD